MPLACGKCGNAGRCVEGGFFANQPAIFQMEDAIAVGEHARVVSDHDDRTSMVMAQSAAGVRSRRNRRWNQARR